MALICKLCGRKTDKIIKIINGVAIYECEHCKLGFVNQQYFKRKKLDRLYSYEEYKKLEKFITKRLDDLTDIIVKYKRKGSVLEIGPGFGLLSSYLLEKGDFDLEVVEPFLIPKYLSKKVYKIHKMDLDTFLKKRKKKYDLIIMLDVIEHLENPFLSLGKLYSLLNKGGVMVIQTPNYKSFMQEMSQKWSWWMVEDHKWFFTPVSLGKIIKRQHLDILYDRSYEDWIDFKKNLDGNFTKFKFKYVRKLAKLLFFIPFVPFYFLTRHLFWKAGRGGLIFSISRKT